MSQAFGGWVLDHHAVAAWARVEPYAQSLVWSAMEVGMRQVEFVDALPLTPTGKVSKRVLREPYWAGRDRAVAGA